MYRLFLGFRYLWARPLSWVSMVGIWLSVMALIVTLGVMSGFLRETRAMIRGTLSDVIVTPLSFGGGQNGFVPAPTFAEIEAAARPVEGIAGMAPRLTRPSLLRIHDGGANLVGWRKFDEHLFVQVVGVDVEKERVATEFVRHLSEPSPRGAPPDDLKRPFELAEVPIELINDDLPVALVGEGLYAAFRMHKGMVITLVTLPERFEPPRGAGSAGGGEKGIRPLSQRFLVGGTVRTGHYQHDQGTIYVTRRTAQRFAEASSDVSEICVRVAEGREPDAVRDALKARFRAERLNAEVETWEDRERGFLNAVENERALLGVILCFFVAVMCFNVFATVTLLVTDKTKDIGILNALGATPSGVLGIFLGSGLIMATIAAGAGAASGLFVGERINAVNDLVHGLTGRRIFREDVYFFRDIPVEITPEFVAGVFVGTVALAVGCAFLPAARAARMDPVAALRHE